eukprot:gene15430-biopygen20184
MVIREWVGIRARGTLAATFLLAISEPPFELSELKSNPVCHSPADKTVQITAFHNLQVSHGFSCIPMGHRTLARAWRGHGADVARATGKFWLGWRGRGAGLSCDPMECHGFPRVPWSFMPFSLIFKNRRRNAVNTLWTRANASVGGVRPRSLDCP